MKRINPCTSSFEKLIKEGWLYVDKTAYIYELITRYPQCILTRPRSFGKSMVVNTMKAIFEGKRELFKGLEIDSKPYDWKTYPIIHIDFCGFCVKTAKELDTWLCNEIKEIATKYEVSLPSDGNSNSLMHKLVYEIGNKYGKCVILIDEYDTPLTDNLYSKELEDIRHVLVYFYAIIKSNYKYIQFAYLTGISCYSSISHFASINNLDDMTLHYNALCGYTQQELEHYFADYIEQGMKKTGLSREEYLQKIKDTYLGYKFAYKEEPVYNPVDISLFFEDGGEDFYGYWLNTGGTKLLTDLVKKKNFKLSARHSLRSSYYSYATFDLADIAKSPTRVSLPCFLVQTGYLTIEGRKSFDNDTYYLNFPNKLVRFRLCKDFLNVLYFPIRSVGVELSFLEEAFDNEDLDKAKEILEELCLKDYAEDIFFTMLLGVGFNLNVGFYSTIATLNTASHTYVIQYIKEKEAKSAERPEGENVHLFNISFDFAKQNHIQWQELKNEN